MIFNSGNATNTARDGNILAYDPLKKQLVLGLGWSDIASNVTGYILGLVWAFALHRRVTFRADTAIGLRFRSVRHRLRLAYATNLELVLSAEAGSAQTASCPT